MVFLNFQLVIETDGKFYELKDNNQKTNKQTNNNQLINLRLNLIQILWLNPSSNEKLNLGNKDTIKSQ